MDTNFGRAVSGLDADGRLRWPWTQLLDVKNEVGAVLSLIGGDHEHADESRAQRAVDSLVGGLWSQPLDDRDDPDLVPIHRGQADGLVAAIDQLRSPTPAQVELRDALARAFPTSHDRTDLRRQHLVTQNAARGIVTAFDRTFSELDLLIGDGRLRPDAADEIHRRIRRIHEWRRTARPTPQVFEIELAAIVSVVVDDEFSDRVVAELLEAGGADAEDAARLAVLLVEGAGHMTQVGRTDPYEDADVHRRIEASVAAVERAVRNAADRIVARSGRPVAERLAGGPRGRGDDAVVLRAALDWIDDRRLRTLLAGMWGWRAARVHLLARFGGRDRLD